MAGSISEPSRIGGVVPAAASLVSHEDPEDPADDATDLEDEPVDTSGPPSQVRVPLPGVEDHWTGILDLSKDPVKLPFGPSNVRSLTKRWGGSTASSAFRALRPDPCLHGAFDKAKVTNKSLVESAASLASAAGAAAHAVLSAASHIEKFVDVLGRVQVDNEEWAQFFASSASDLKKDVVSPLMDAAALQASVYGKAVSSVHSGVIAAAETPVKSALKDIPPSGGFYFGDPAERLTANMSYAVMAAQLASTSSSSRGKRGGAASSFSRRPPSSITAAKSTVAASSASTAKSSVLPFRGGKGGRKSK